MFRGKWAWVPLALLLLVNRAEAQSDTRAAELFEQALGEYDRHEYDAAATHLEAAYELLPRYPVLYNLALVYAASNRASAAIATFQKYLSDGGREIDDVRQQGVRVRIAELMAETGLVQVDVSPEGAEIRIDERSPAIPRQSPTRLDAGPHALRVTAGGFETYSTTILVAPGEQLQHLIVQLRPLAGSGAPGFIGVSCPVPGVALHIDGSAAGMTPLRRAIGAPAGQHLLQFVRDGYTFATPRAVEVTAGSLADVNCAASRADRKPTDPGARLVVTDSQTRASVDGTPYFGELLSSGLHRLEVGTGSSKWSADMSLRPGETRPLPARVSPESDGKALSRQWSYILAGAGAVLGLTAGAIALYDNSRYHDWQSRNAELARERAKNPDGSTLARDARNNDALGRSIEHTDGIALGLAIGGGCLVTAGGALWVNSILGPARDRAASVVWSGTW